MALDAKLVRFGLWRSLASALAWGARGPGFKSRQPDQIPQRLVASEWALRALGWLYANKQDSGTPSFQRPSNPEKRTSEGPGGVWPL